MHAHALATASGDVASSWLHRVLSKVYYPLMDSGALLGSAWQRLPRRRCNAESHPSYFGSWSQVAELAGVWHQHRAHFGQVLRLSEIAPG